MKNRDQILTPRMVEGMIAEGHTIVIFEDLILRLDSWLDKHPGGKLAILHMVGRDATDEIKAYHSAPTMRLFKAFRIGRHMQPGGRWPSTTPPIRGGVYRKLEPDAFESNGADLSESHLTGSSGTDSDGASITSSEDAALGSSVFSLSQCSTNSLDGLSIDEYVGMRKRNPHHGTNMDVGDLLSKRLLSARSPEAEPMSKDGYTDWAVKQEVDRDLIDYPPIEPDVQEDIIRKYRDLHDKVHDMGYYDCPYGEYAKESARYLTLFAASMFALYHNWYMTSAVFLGLFWHQIMFTAHDAGHRAITHNFVVDTLIGLFIADFCCGLSLGWWKSSHNVHHLVTNQPEHDPDIQNVPLFATCPSYFRGIVSTYYDGFPFLWDAVADIMVPLQKYTYYPIMGLARFNLYLLSWLHVISTRASSLGGSKAWWIRPTEIAFMACYWFIFGYCLIWRTLPTWTIRVAFVLVSHIVTMPLHVQITLSHWGMSTADLGEGESFPQRQLRTTMDVDCPAWLDFIHGGLQFQAVHHLFPRVPRHNLRKVQVLVREFCRETEIPYSICNFVDGNKVVLGRLDEVAQQVKILMACQGHMAETGESGLH
ncbi:fatty acid desaturase [Apodospora peruviana]|uniref:Delta 8-(E)-sphingolipid desaturase n=1 Tax=Apodospora peruviana TaxID=516989 RepID=A0AAE0M075_9PEZI|nr:fatty acid desaturase [Apodospora peruviana]